MKARYKSCRFNGVRMRVQRKMVIEIIGDLVGARVSEFCIHHIDGNKMNNDSSNLKLMRISDHNKLHAATKRRDSRGRFAK